MSASNTKGRGAGRQGQRYVLAVSGGVDSVVLLDTFAHLPHELLVVAHFDHGIRGDSAEDARFVEALAVRYNLPFELRREELGASASEDLARQRRYAFLREAAEKYRATIVTAHHADDVIETIAINLTRGTGWRGLAVLNDTTLVRPLRSKWKKDLIEYAVEHRLEWVEDSTNQTDAYLRNRLRQRIAAAVSIEEKKDLHKNWWRQCQLTQGINNEIAHLLKESPVYTRYFMTMIPYETAYELLRAAVLEAGGPSLLRSQLVGGVIALRTARAGSEHHLTRGVTLRCSKDRWSIHSDKKMLP